MVSNTVDKFAANNRLIQNIKEEKLRNMSKEALKVSNIILYLWKTKICIFMSKLWKEGRMSYIVTYKKLRSLYKKKAEAEAGL